jgi:hypothetical protein
LPSSNFEFAARWATKIRSKLQAASDAAGTMTSDGPIQAGVNDATKIFNGNVSGVAGYTMNSFIPAVTKTGIKLTSNIQFSADVPTMFLGVIGKSKMTVTGTSNSSASLPPYLDFYLMLDVSGSMGLPSTNNEQTRLAAVNPDNFVQYPGGCTLACHFAVQNVCSDGVQGYPTNNYCLGYAISRISQAGYNNILRSTTKYPKKQQLPT